MKKDVLVSDMRHIYCIGQSEDKKNHWDIVTAMETVPEDICDLIDHDYLKFQLARIFQEEIKRAAQRIDENAQCEISLKPNSSQSN